MSEHPRTVGSYAEAVSCLSSGQFTRQFAEHSRKLFASVYGAPFFAMAELAPELLEASNPNLLVIDSIGWLAAEGGRWLSLYARVPRPARRFVCTICTVSKPRPVKAPKPLLFQPPQQVLIKSWRKHLRDLEVAPEAVIAYAPDDFIAVEDIAEEFHALLKGRKALFACRSHLDALLLEALFNARGCQTSGVLGYDAEVGKPRHFATGAWWFSVTFPSKESEQSIDEGRIESLRVAHDRFCRLLQPTIGLRDEVGSFVEAYATRSIVRVEGESIDALRISAAEGIDLASGRRYSVRAGASTGEEIYCWNDEPSASRWLFDAPVTSQGGTVDQERLAWMLWLGRALAEEVQVLTSLLPSEAEAPDAQTDERVVSEPVTATEVAEIPVAALDEASTLEPGTSATLPPRSRLSRSAGAVNVLALAALLVKAGQSPEQAFFAAKSRMLAWLSGKGFSVSNPAVNQHIELPDGELTIETDGQSIWSMRFDDRKSMEQGAIWRVEATLVGSPRSAGFGLRLIQVRSSEEAPAPVISGVPQVVATIAREVGLEDAGVALATAAVRLASTSDATKLEHLLLNSARTQPVIVVSGQVDASADRLAKRLAGVAHVVCIENDLSSLLIRRFGRERSVYGHAVRLYRPGFTLEDDPYRHPFWTLKGTQLPKWLVNDIFEQACAISLDVGDLDERVPSFQAVRNHLAEQRLVSSEQRLAALRQQAENEVSSKDEQINRLQAINAELETALAQYKSSSKDLANKLERLQGELQATSKERDSALDDARQLKRQLDNRWTEDEPDKDELADDSYFPDTWDELEDWVEIYGDDKLVILPQAAKAARESPFKDIAFAYRALDYLVQHYAPMRTREKGDTEAYQNSQRALAVLGLELSKVGTALDDSRYKQEYRRQYEGRNIWLDDHLKKGVGFDPAVIFRLYFHYDEATAKVVVGHLPTHLTNRITHSG